MRRNYNVLGLFLFLVVAIPARGQYNDTNNSIANKSAVVHERNVRFTVLTPDLVRMEWNGKNQFVDEASFVVVNRYLSVPNYKVSRKNGWIVIETDNLTLKYRLHSGKFNANNLKIDYKSDAHFKINWLPGMLPKQNLKGTARTLDKFDGNVNLKGDTLSLEPGIISKDGWYFLDDSKSFLFDNSPWAWVKERKDTLSQDWYFMGYGHEYKKALYTFSQISGKIPLPPRYAFGYWWSRYWKYSDNELRDLVTDFRRYNIPLDVLVMDMDWHTTDSIIAKDRDEFGYLKWWTGWTWNKRLFPDPAKFLQWTKDENLKVTLNVHPASGIAPFEDVYSVFAKAMGFDTSTRRNIPFIGSSKKFMTNLFDIILHPMQKEGVDFWWLDWQQRQYDEKIKTLSNTWWINYVFFSDMERNGSDRPLIYHRWGGLGNHRYQVGFSGDTFITWNSLGYQPYFTNTASNVLYGYWSHDIGGHVFRNFRSNKEKINPELYTRWMQYGALSPIMRTHSTKSSNLNKEPWNFTGDYYKALYNAIRLRYELNPYIYTMARKTYDSAISICRPMYYDYPEKNEAYEFENEYMFGDDILVAPIVAPMSNGVSTIRVWLPEGTDWYEWQTGTLLKGGQIVERNFSLDEYPIYIKSGAIIPMYSRSVNNLEENAKTIKLGIFPGGNYSTNMYEDEGNSKMYDAEHAFTKFSTKVEDGRLLTLTIYPREGEYKNMLMSRRYEIKLYGSQMPQSITVNGKDVHYSANIDKNSLSHSWNYTGSDLSTNIVLPEYLCSDRIEVRVTYNISVKPVDINGLPQKFNRLSKATNELKLKSPEVVLTSLIGELEETNRQIEYYPKKFNELIDKFNNNYKKIPASIQQMNISREIKEWYLNALKLDNQ